MSNRWALIETADDSWDGLTMVEAEPEAPGDGSQYVVRVPPSYPNDTAWSPALKGFVDRFPAVVETLITVGRFLTLLTLAEQASIHTAAKTDAEVEALLFMLQGFTSGISLGDPMLGSLLQIMVEKSLLTADRVTAILAGEAP
jgi:hypothetical protein